MQLRSNRNESLQLNLYDRREKLYLVRKNLMATIFEIVLLVLSFPLRLVRPELITYNRSISIRNDSADVAGERADVIGERLPKLQCPNFKITLVRNYLRKI